MKEVDLGIQTSVHTIYKSSAVLSEGDAIYKFIGYDPAGTGPFIFGFSFTVYGKTNTFQDISFKATVSTDFWNTGDFQLGTVFISGITPSSGGNTQFSQFDQRESYISTSLTPGEYIYAVQPRGIGLGEVDARFKFSIITSGLTPEPEITLSVSSITKNKEKVVVVEGEHAWIKVTLSEKVEYDIDVRTEFIPISLTQEATVASFRIPAGSKEFKIRAVTALNDNDLEPKSIGQIKFTASKADGSTIKFNGGSDTLEVEIHDNIMEGINQQSEVQKGFSIAIKFIEYKDNLLKAAHIALRNQDPDKFIDVVIKANSALKITLEAFDAVSYGAQVHRDLLKAKGDPVAEYRVYQKSVVDIIDRSAEAVFQSVSSAAAVAIMTKVLGYTALASPPIAAAIVVGAAAPFVYSYFQEHIREAAANKFSEVVPVPIRINDQGFLMKNEGGGNDIVIASASLLNMKYGTNKIDHVFYNGGDRLTLSKNIENATLLEVGGASVNLIAASSSFSLAAAGASVIGNALNNVLTGNSLANVLIGQAGNDRLIGGGGHDALRGGAGNDLLIGGIGKDTLDGGMGRDTADYSDKQLAVAVTLAGARNALVKVGGTVEDTIRNIENLTGGKGNDRLEGDAGANILRGMGGNDILIGGAGNDRLIGEAAHDALRGGIGKDILIGGIGKDTLDGGMGRDTADYSDKQLAVAVTLAGARNALVKVGDTVEDTIRNIENITGGKGNDRLEGDAGANILRGMGGNDILIGGAGNDRLIGEAAHDALRGGIGKDILIGGIGKDTLDGGMGADTLAGGAGADTFLFRKNFDHENILDFQDNIDTIRMLNFEVTNFTQARTYATQSGVNVVFDFGAGDILTLRNTTINALADDMVFV